MEQEVMGENAMHVAKENTKWISHYSNKQHILLVGEGDFSFSSCLATTFGTANRIIATSLDSSSDLQQKYGKDAITNISNLANRGALVFYNVDVCHMATKHATPLCSVQQTLFDCIIFNFPYAGFPSTSKVEEVEKIILKHKELVRLFFANASCMLLPGGEVHVSHKQGDVYNQWKLEEHAQMVGLQLVKSTPFLFETFPGYRTRRGAAKEAGRCFPLDQASTYIFSRTMRPEMVIVHDPLLQSKSGPPNLGDLRLGEDGGCDSKPSFVPTIMHCDVAMKATREGNIIDNKSTSSQLGVMYDSESSSFPTAMRHVAMKAKGEDYNAVLLQVANLKTKLVQKGQVSEMTLLVQILADEVTHLEKKHKQFGKKKLMKLKSFKSALNDIKVATLEDEASDLLDPDSELPICLRFCEFCVAEFKRKLKKTKDVGHSC